MGKDIVRQEPKSLGKRRRLWGPKDIVQVLRYNKGTDSIQGIKLDMSQNEIDNLRLCPTAFENMLNLRYIHFYNCWKKKLLSDQVESLPDELRYLCWEYYPFKSLSSSFNPNNRVVLKLSRGNMEQLWNEDYQELVNLREIELLYCKKLKKIPNLLGAINLKTIDCRWCKSLVELPCLNHLRSLERLDLSGCKNLRKIPNLLGAINLKFLDCRWCKSLVELLCLNQLASLETFKIEGCHVLKKSFEIDLSKTRIEEMPDLTMIWKKGMDGLRD